MQPDRRCSPCDSAHVCSATTSAEMLRDLREWMTDAAEEGVPHFGELGYRLGCYRELLAKDFATEESKRSPVGKSEQLNECQHELDGLRRQHGQFLDELLNLKIKLHQEYPPFESWQEAVRQFECLQVEIDRHVGREFQLEEAVRQLRASGLES